jgi:hypothetical protein
MNNASRWRENRARFAEPPDFCLFMPSNVVKPHLPNKGLIGVFLYTRRAACYLSRHEIDGAPAMIVLQGLYFVATFTIWFVVPALLLATRITGGFRGTSHLDRVTLTLIVGAFAVPAFYFSAFAMALAPISAPVTTLLAALLLLLLTAGDRSVWRAATLVWRADDTPSWGAFGLAAVGAAIFAFVYQVLFFDSVGAFHFGCTYGPCAMAGGLLDVPKIGALNASLAYPGHQRMGITAILAPAMNLYGLFGLRVQWGLIFASLPLTVFSLARRGGLRGTATAAAALAAGLLPCLFLVPDQNRAVLAMTAAAAFLLMLPTGKDVFSGAFLALIFGAEPATILVLPAVVLFLGRGDATWPRRIAKLALGFAIGAAPFFARYFVAFGSPVFHEHFSITPPVSYDFLGFRINVPAFFGWPFRAALVRSTYNPLPNLALVPLSMLRHFGLALAAVGLTGAVGMIARAQYRRFIAGAALLVPLALALAVNEDWTQTDKWAIVTMAYLPVLLALGHGVDWLADGGTSILKRSGVYLLALTLLVVAHNGLRTLPSVEDRLFRQLWDEQVQWLPPEPEGVMTFEQNSIRERHWLPGQKTFLPLATLLRGANVRSLTGELATLSLAGRAPSLMETFFATLFQYGPMAKKMPKVNLGDRGELSFATGEVVRLDLSVPPDRALAGGSPAGCLADAAGTTVLPLQKPVLVSVPWQERPIRAALAANETADYAMAMVVRTMLRDEEDGDWGIPRPDACMAFHVPAGKGLLLIDFLSLNPTRLYLYRVDRSDGVPTMRYLGSR